jgi:hypothetical protein
MAVTTPLVVTEAMEVLLDDQLPTRSDRVLPAASLATPPTRRLAPTSRVMAEGQTAAETTPDEVTVIFADPDFPSTVAVIRAVPTVRAVMSPVEETETMVG